MIPSEWFGQALERIRQHSLRTPLTYDAEHQLFLKWENQQVTGSFKARGALNKVLSLEEWERKAGLVAASAGNHGQGVALAARLTDSSVEVFVPERAVLSKVDAIRSLGGKVTFVRGGYGEAEAAAKAHTLEARKTFVSPYNDAQVIAGQGTIALEVIQQLRDEFHRDPHEVSVWIVPTGGGGLISGCGAALASHGLHPRLVGVQPEASAFTYSWFHRHSQEGVRDDPTLADGLSGAMDGDSVTLPMMRELVSDMVTVSEAAIEGAIAFAWWSCGEKIEGSAAAALGAALDGRAGEGPCVVVVTGGNIQTEAFEQILARHPAKVVP